MKEYAFPIARRREKLDGPVDQDIQITEVTGGHKLSLMMEGEAVSWGVVYGFDQQIGEQTVRMGGIGGVGTLAAHRNKGYSRRVMENSLRWMRGNGCDVTMLLGISGYYPKFGYAEAFPDVSFSMSVREAEAARLPRHAITFVDFDRRYLQAILAMHRKSNGERSGPIRRDPDRWEPFRKGIRWGSKSICRVALNGSKKPVGYFVYDAEELNPVIIETGYGTTEAFAAMLAEMVRITWSQRLERIRFLLPEDDAFIGFCQPFGVQKIVEYRRDGGGMVRMINIAFALEKVGALLGSRLCGSGELDVHTNLDSVGVSWSNGTFRVGKLQGSRQSVRMPQWALAQMLYGYRSAGMLSADGVLKASTQTIDVLEELFPVTPHFFYHVDWF